MKRLIRIALCFGLLMLAVSVSVFGQKEYEVHIVLNRNIDLKKIIISVDNGKTEYQPVKAIAGRQIKIKGKYFGEYAEILVKYANPKVADFFLLSTFFVQDQVAKILFHPVADRMSVLKHYTLVNAFDFREEKDKMAAYDSASLRRAEAFAMKYSGKMFENSILTNQYFELEHEVYDQDLRYILENPESYFAFSFFRRNFVKSNRLSTDSILAILDIFPGRYKNSEEGKVIRNLVNGWKEVRLKGKAPDFKVKDILGNTYVLNDLLNNGMVLLNFWATWCGPCIEEMPALKSISKNYRSGGLTVISVAYPSNHEDYLKDIERYQMDWINVYDDVDLINAYGGNLPIPRLYLLDSSGTIIYDRQADPDNSNLDKLKKLLSAISK